MILFLLASNSFKKIMSLRTTSQGVREQEKKLASLQAENEALKHEFQYKQSEKFVEGEIRDRLGLAKEGEQVFALPNQVVSNTDQVAKKVVPNWKKWQKLILGKG